MVLISLIFLPIRTEGQVTNITKEKIKEVESKVDSLESVRDSLLSQSLTVDTLDMDADLSEKAGFRGGDIVERLTKGTPVEVHETKKVSFSLYVLVSHEKVKDGFM